MASRAAFIVIGVGTWLGIGLLGGCNAVLDIEEAHSNASATGVGGGAVINTPGDADSCKASNAACSSCISGNCSPIEQGQCTSNAACRKVADQYATCLGPDCKPDVVGCLEHLYDGDSQVPKCIITSCQSDCAPVPVYSACELYCGCMASNCMDKFDSVQECVMACQAFKNPETVNCRRTHCEIAPFDKSLPHCDHAVGIDTCSDTDPVVRQSTCPNKSLKGFYCAADSDCCSNNCNLMTKACANP